MKNVILFSAASLLALGVVTYAETDPKALPILQDIQKGKDNSNQIKILRVKGAATIGGALTVAGAVTATGAQSAASYTAPGAVQGSTLALSATQWFDIVDTTQLVFIAAGVTNVIDADITTP